MPFPLLRCLAHAIGKNGVKFLCGLAPGGEILFEIANDAWEEYRQAQQENARRAEVQSLAQASPEQVQQAVEEAVRSEAADLPDDARQKLTAYLGQVPGMIRRSLRRPSDPTGKTVPASLSLRHPEDLLPFLPPRPPRFQAGSRPLPGVPWVLEEPLGIGGFGEVWKVRYAHMRNKPPVALKFCLDPSAAKVLRNEAGVLDRLMRHGRMPGIVPLLQAYLDADPPCLEYEYVEGGDLAALIREWHAQRAPSAAWANWLLLQLAETIAAAHRADPAIVHDDLKPANILVQRAADRPKLYVTDYSIGGLALARAVKQTRLPTNSREQLLTETVRGAYTPLYASPQQMTRKRDEPADPRDDVHALGVIWYQLLTGDLTMVRVPTDWTDELRGRGLTEDLTRLLGACFADKAEKRPANAGILAGELRAPITPSPIAPQPAPAPISSHPKTGEQKRLPQAEAAPSRKSRDRRQGKRREGASVSRPSRPIGRRRRRRSRGCRP